MQHCGRLIGKYLSKGITKKSSKQEVRASTESARQLVVIDKLMGSSEG